MESSPEGVTVQGPEMDQAAPSAAGAGLQVAASRLAEQNLLAQRQHALHQHDDH